MDENGLVNKKREGEAGDQRDRVTCSIGPVGGDWEALERKGLRTQGRNQVWPAKANVLRAIHTEKVALGKDSELRRNLRGQWHMGGDMNTRDSWVRAAEDS